MSIHRYFLLVIRPHYAIIGSKNSTVYELNGQAVVLMCAQNAPTFPSVTETFGLQKEGSTHTVWSCTVPVSVPELDNGTGIGRKCLMPRVPHGRYENKMDIASSNQTVACISTCIPSEFKQNWCGSAITLIK